MQRKCRHSDTEYIKIKQRTIAAVMRDGWKDHKLNTKFEKQANRLKSHGFPAVERKETNITSSLSRASLKNQERMRKQTLYSPLLKLVL